MDHQMSTDKPSSSNFTSQSTSRPITTFFPVGIANSSPIFFPFVTTKDAKNVILSLYQ
jgi:hypothetical protein